LKLIAAHAFRVSIQPGSVPTSVTTILPVQGRQAIYF
jgi:hypothetical protein